MLAAERLGAKVPQGKAQPIPAAPDGAAAVGAITALLRGTLEYQAGLGGEQSQRLEAIAGEAAKSAEQLERLVAVMQERNEAATADEVAGLIAALDSSMAAKIAAVELRVASLQSLLDSCLTLLQAILQSQYDPVIPEYDVQGKVIRARRHKE